MSEEILKNYMQSIIPAMSDRVVKKLISDFEYLFINKQTLLITENIPNNRTYFLETGYVNSFVVDNNGIEVTTNIYSAPCFVNDFTSFFKQLPSTQSYRTVTDCMCWTMSLEKVEYYFHTMPEYREFGRLLLLDHYDKLNERMLEMIKDSAEMRYLKLLSNNPDVIHNVPLKVIASFLGITDTSLSRIRKEVFKK